MNRIFEKDATVEYRDIWLNTIPKVFQIAADETSNSPVQSLLDDGGDCPSECKLEDLMGLFLTIPV